MNGDRVVAESKVSRNQTNIPGCISRELDIDDGDHIRWILESGGSVQVEIVPQETRTFDEFDGYDGGKATDVASDHDSWGVE